MDGFTEAGRNLVVIGASAGGVETLRRVVSGLPEDLDAAVCVVLHLAPTSPSALAGILQRVTRMPCRAAGDSQPLRRGEILVAPPDHHLVIADGRAELSVGPRENGHRPAVDALFRSAAEARQGSVIGVILSGTRDDGTGGLATIKLGGGTAIVQDPEDALYAGMPASAIAHVDVDAVVPAAEIADLIVRIVSEGAVPDRLDPPDLDPPGPDPPPPLASGDPVTTICPECGGVLSAHAEGGMVQWRCRVGHRYSLERVDQAQPQDVEAAMWAAVRALEDRKTLLERMAADQRSAGNSRAAGTFAQRAVEAGGRAGVVRSALADAAETTLRQTMQTTSAGGSGGEA